jgi:hypothetical protein
VSRLNAQVTAGASPGLNAALVRFFGDITAFTAHLEIRMVDDKGAETLNAPMQFALLDGRMRGEIEIAKLKSNELPALASTAVESVGMDRVVTLVRPDNKESYLYYPSFQACIVAPIAREDLEALKQPATLQKTPLGKETLNGHPCVKNKVIVSGPGGARHEAIVWNATDLKDFPLQIQTQDGADTIILRFQNVKFERPDPKLFNLPEGTVKYRNVTELTQAMVKKLLGQAIGH